MYSRPSHILYSLFREFSVFPFDLKMSKILLLQLKAVEATTDNRVHDRYLESTDTEEQPPVLILSHEFSEQYYLWILTTVGT